MKISKETAQALADDDEVNAFKIIENKLVGHSRWSLVLSLILEKDDKYYTVEYSTGSTELQDEIPFEYDEDEIELAEVTPQQILTTIYVPVDE